MPRRQGLIPKGGCVPLLGHTFQEESDFGNADSEVGRGRPWPSMKASQLSSHFSVSPAPE
jgi:hypothetical protein